MIGKTLSHYLVVERIGAGGMGEVYRARDEMLKRDVALKVLPPGMLADEGARRRFHKEALALAKLNHPNIATVHEFGSQNDRDFLVTEYIAGISLDDKLANGALPASEVARLGTELAQGLAAAHGQNIVHRDLKPANLRLTTDGRLKILDFGLAQFIPRGDEAMEVTLSATQAVVGTLPYMPPEQLRGETTDERADIWGAGAVLYEMATGRRPFPEGTGAVLVDAILNRDPEAPSKVNPKITPHLESVILKALQKLPANRYASAKELAADLERLATGGAPAAVPSNKSRRSWVVFGTSLVICGAAFAGYLLTMKHPNSATPAKTAKIAARRSVAVLGFKNVSGKPELAWLSTALSEMLTTELAAGEQLRTIPGESVAQMKISLAPPDTESYNKQTLAKIRQILGADDVVLGSYVPVGDGQIRLDLRLQDAVAGETLASISTKGPEANLDELAATAGAELRAKLGVGEISAVQSAAVKASLPANPEAARLYAEGLERLRVFDDLGAKDKLQKSIELDPKFAQSHRALASAWKNLGYDAKAKEEAQKAFVLSEGLSREERISIEARYRETTNEWDKAVELYSTLFGFFSDNLEYGLQLAAVQTAAGSGQAALGTVEKLRSFPSPQREDPRIDLTESHAAAALGDFQHSQTAASRAVAKGQAQGSQLLVARALTQDCASYRQLGEAKKALAACEEAQRIYAATGDLGSKAMVVNNIANIYYDQGEPAEAKKLYEQTLASYRQIGFQKGVAGALDNIANVVGDLGQPAEARKLSQESLIIYHEIGDDFGAGETLNNIAAEWVLEGNQAEAGKALEGSLKIWRELGNKTGAATTLNNLGELLLDQGDLAQAKAKYEEALTIFRDSGQKDKTSYPLLGLGEVALAGGDLAGAAQKYEQVRVLCSETKDKHQVAAALDGLGRVRLQQGDLASAQESFEESLALRKEIGEKGSVAESELTVAEVQLDQGRAADAEKLARGALEEFQVAKQKDDEVVARTVLAQSLLAQGKNADARKQIEAAEGLAARSGLSWVRWKYAIAAARVSAAAGGRKEAIASLEKSKAEASKHGFREYQYEAELALGELEVKSGESAAGKARLAALEKAARASGFVRIADKAAALRPANERADSPKMVTLFGSPPNAAIFCFTHLSAASWSINP
jgi:eukaryotic-like serine/threonine-protein kinase